jgi:flagellar basal body P-ring formation protein FlgA
MRNFVTIKCCLIACFWPVLSAQSALPQGEGGGVWTLLSSVHVDGTGVFLHELIESEGPVAEDIRLADAPAAGKAFVYSRGRVAEMSRMHAPGLFPTNWAGALQVKVARRSRSLEESELKDLLTQKLQQEHVRERGELELRFTRAWPRVLIPDEPFTLRILDLPAAGVTPNFIVRFELRTARELIGTWQAPLQARVWQDLWVARSAQPRGRLLQEADVVLERRDVLTSRGALADLDPNDPALELAEPLQAGALLTARSLRLRPVISRGALVEALLQDGSMMISIKAEAMEEGAPGQFIRVRNVRSKREFRAKVENEHTVTLSL